MTNMGQGGFGQGQMFQNHPGAMLGGAGAAMLAGGALSSLFNPNGFFGKPEGVEQYTTMSPQQLGGANQMLQQGMQNSNFGDIRNQEINRFNQQTVPSLAARFTGMGGQGGQRSSGFQQALGMSGANLGTDLAGMQSQYGMHQMEMGMRPQFENVMRPAGQGGMEQGLQGLMSMLPYLMYL